jgi:hypothetical protein
MNHKIESSAITFAALAQPVGLEHARKEAPTMSGVVIETRYRCIESDCQGHPGTRPRFTALSVLMEESCECRRRVTQCQRFRRIVLEHVAWLPATPVGLQVSLDIRAAASDLPIPDATAEDRAFLSRAARDRVCPNLSGNRDERAPLSFPGRRSVLRTRETRCECE